MISWISQSDRGVCISILAQPKASRSEIVGLHGEPARLKVRVAAPPVDGEANEELIRFFSKALKVPKKSLQIVRGETSKQKDLMCEGLTLEEVAARLGLSVPP